MKLARIRDPNTGETLRGQVVKGEMLKTEGGTLNLSDVKLLPPVEPTKIVCVGLNYRGHIKERGRKLPDRPTLFFKPLSSLIGPQDPIVITEKNRYDPEGEVAVVIERDCRNVKKKDALDYIWGYTGLNDVTNRDAQEWERNWVRTKGFDTAAPVGPFLVTPEDIDLPISFQLEVNGSLRQASDTSELVFGIPELIEEISSFMTLKRGDIIATGTPKGISPINPGDVVSLKIDGLGVLENPVTL